MQGRLVPPVDGELQAFPLENWADEFPFAVQASLDCIEWIFDLGTEDQNPIYHDNGLAQLKSLSEAHGIEIRSVCADYFMRRPLLDVAENERQADLKTLRKLIGNAATLGANRVVIPFVDNSSIKTKRDQEIVIENLQDVSPYAGGLGVELHLEADFGPTDFARFMEEIGDRNVKVNYDSGNSSGLGFLPHEELMAYGNFLGSVHIKDRVLGGTSVPLGTGSADFESLFSQLARLDYDGDIILQAARGEEGDEVRWAQKNRDLVLGWLGS